MLITENYAKAIRRKQADMQLTAKQAGEQIGVNHITYRKLRSGGVRNGGHRVGPLQGEWLCVRLEKTSILY